jgi:putative N6-adenine-specific DNA methylase
VASFEARSFVELERHARRIPWARMVGATGAVRFRVTCRKSRLYHSDAVAQRLGDAVLRAVPGAKVERGARGAADDDAATTPVDGAEGPSPTDDAQLYVVRIFHDR